LKIRILSYSFTILLIVSSIISAFSQKIEDYKISNVYFEHRADSIVINYTIENFGQDAMFYVTITPYVSTSVSSVIAHEGSKYAAKTFFGDIGIVPQGNHSVVWDYKKDSLKIFNKLVYFEIKASVITQNSFAQALSKSILAPGIGSYEYNKKKPYWIYSAVGYGLLGTAITSNYLAQQKYSEYKSISDIDIRNKKYKDVHRLSNLSRFCFVGAGVTWSISLSDIIYKNHLYTKPNSSTIQEERLYTIITKNSSSFPISTISFSESIAYESYKKEVEIIRKNEYSPKIELLNPVLHSGNIRTNSESIIIKAKITCQSKINSIILQGNQVYIQDSILSRKIYLKPGVNKISIEAISLNDTSKYVFQITRNDNTTMESKYYALIIGEENYIDKSIQKLDNPINDCSKLYNILTTNYTFNEENIIFLKNPSRSVIIETFELLVNSLGSNDNLLIFYAGHGVWDSQLSKGFWLPSDAILGYKG